MKHKIYVLIDPRNNDVRYVGRTIQTLDNRLKKHLRAIYKSHRVNWIKSLTLEKVIPIIELICEVNDFEECKKMERFYIDKYRKDGYDLVNMTDGGDGSIGFKHSEDSKNKISEITKERITKERMSKPEVIENLRDKGNQQWHSLTPEEQNKLILKQPNRKSITQHTINGDFIKEFISLREIERELGFYRANISPCLKGKFKQAYGFIWRYSD